MEYWKCQLRHNETDEPVIFNVPMGIEPVSFFTDFDASHSNVLFIARRDFYTDEYEMDIKDGGVYYVPTDYAEMSSDNPDEITIEFTGIKCHDDLNYNEWIATVLELHNAI